jgi:O-antigen biosynthesis protein WbqP
MRFFDLTLASIGLFIGAPVFLLIYIASYLDTGSPLLRQKRVGKMQRPFILVKFRTMRLGTASVATHLADASAITPFGRILRRTKLDELPQLWNVLVGDMSLVGPRPCLPTQKTLVNARDALGVYQARPGITGLAQIRHIDMSTPELLASTDAQMLKTLTIRQYFMYIVKTLSGKGRGDKVKD